MTNDKYLHFVGNKIEKLGTAIFSISDARNWKYPVLVIRNLKTDDHGNVRFLMENTLFDDQIPGLKFFAQLQPYNKDFNYYIKAEGYATIVTEEIKLSDGEYPSQSSSNKTYLVSLSIRDARYSSWHSVDHSGSHRINELVRWLFTDRIQARSLHVQF